MGVTITKTKDVVQALLQNHRSLRDSDERLICNVWVLDLIKIGVKYDQISGQELMNHFVQGNLTNPESIRRVRQKIQEEDQSLRGKFYKNRKAKTEAIKKELGYDIN